MSAAPRGLGGLARGSAAVFLIQIATVGVGLVGHAVLARALGVAVYGDYAYAFSFVLLLSLVGRAVGESASMRFVATYLATERWALLRGFVRGVTLLTALVSVGFAAALAVGAAAFTAARPELRFAFLVGALAIPLMAVCEVAVAMLKALRAAVGGYAVGGLLRRLAFVAAVILAWYIGWLESASHAMALQVASGGLFFLVLLFYVRRRLPAEARGVRPAYDVAAWRGTTFSLFAFGVVTLAMAQTDTILLGALRTTTEAGVYSVAAKITPLVLFGQAAVNALLTPEIARLHAAGDRVELERLAILAARGATLLALVTGGILAGAGGVLLGFFGDGFSPAHPPLLILVAGQVVAVSCGSAAFLMNMTGYQRDALFVLAVAFTANAIGNVLLIPPLGAIGAAVATAISAAALGIALALRVERRLGIRCAVFRRAR